MIDLINVLTVWHMFSVAEVTTRHFQLKEIIDAQNYCGYNFPIGFEGPYSLSNNTSYQPIMV